MKKLLMVAAALSVVFVAWRAYAEDHDERDLWAEVTDPVE